MNPRTRKKINDYAIAIALVVLATGLLLLLQASWPLIIILNQLVVGVAVWKRGWRAGMAATLASTAVLIGFFGAVDDFAHAAVFVFGCLVLCVAVRRPIGRTRDRAMPLLEGVIASGGEQSVASFVTAQSL